MTRSNPKLLARREVLLYLNGSGGAEREAIVEHVTDEVDELSGEGAREAVDKLESDGEIYAVGNPSVYRRVSFDTGLG